MGKKTPRERGAAEGRSETGTQAATGELKAHPYAEQFPLMEGAEYERFKRDIERNGLIDPITVRDGLILDGRHRYRACRELGIEPRTVEWSGPGSVLAFVAGRNAHRRQLTDGGRALTAAGIATLKPGRPGKTASIEAVSQGEAAEHLGVSRTDVQHAARVLRCGDAELAAMVRRGEVAVSAAAAVAGLPAARRALAVAEGAAAIARTAAQLRRAKATGVPDGTATPDVEAKEGDPAPGPDEPAEAAHPADAATPEADMAAGRDPGRYPLRRRLANPAVFDGELEDYWDHADRRAREGGGTLDRETYFRLFDAATFCGKACLSVRRDLILPPEEWSLCGDCKGEGRESSGICTGCGAAGFLNFPDLTQACRFAKGLALATDATSAAIAKTNRRGRKRGSTAVAGGNRRAEATKARESTGRRRRG